MDKKKIFSFKIIASILCICLIFTSLFVGFYAFPLLAAQEEAEGLALTPSEGEEEDISDETGETETGEEGFSEKIEEQVTEQQGSFENEGEQETEGQEDTELPYESPVEPSLEHHGAESSIDEIVLRDANENTPAFGTISKDTTWTAGILNNGELIIEKGVTLTITGQIDIRGTVTIKGGGRILRGDVNGGFLISSADVTISDITMEGNSLVSGPFLNVGFSKLTLDDGCIIQNCVRNENGMYGTAVMANQSEIIFNDIIIQNCTGINLGGAVSIMNCNMTINDGLYQNNKATGSWVGSVVYNMDSKLYIYGGRFIGNIASGKTASGCITSTGRKDNEVYFYGGYFEGNRSVIEDSYSIYNGKDKGGAFYINADWNTFASDSSIFCLSGDVQFRTDDVEGSGVDGIYLGRGGEIFRKVEISSTLNYPVYLYVRASEEYVIAKGAGNGYILQEKDVNQIHVNDWGHSEKTWYACLNKKTNEIYLSETPYESGYYVYYSANGGEGAVTDDTEYTDGEEAIIKSNEGFTYEGYIFNGWNTKPDGNGISYEAGNKVEMTDDLTLYAQWVKEDNRKATFYSGAAGHTKVVEAEDENGIITTPSLEVMDGWTAVGWEESISGYTGGISENMEITLSEDTSYYGIYKKDVTLSYDANGGINAPDNETKNCYANVNDFINYSYEDDTKFTVGHESDPQNEDAIFIGWNDKSDGTGTLYKTGDTIILTEDIVLYAVYEVPPFATFYYGKAGNYIKRGVNSLTGNHTIEVPSRKEMETLDMSNWTALGFNKKTDDYNESEDTIKYGTTITLGEDDLEFYGIYEKDVTLTYAYEDTSIGKDIIDEQTQNCHANVHNEITYQSSDGLLTSYDGFKFTVALGEEDLNIPDGYKFVGWSKDMENAGQLYQEGDEITIQDDTTLYTQWTLMEYEVKFDLNGAQGEAPEAQHILYGSSLQTVADPEMKGYRFAGWYKDQEGTEGNQWDFEKNVEQNTSEYVVTLYAKYVDDIAPVLGETSYNTGYKNVMNWIVRKKNLILTVPITEEGSGIKEASYIMTPDEGMAQFKANDGMTDSDEVKMGIADVVQENGQHVAKITVAEDFKGSVSLTCTDNAGNISPAKLITASDGGIIVEDNAPEIIFSSPDGKLSDYHLDKLTVNVSVEDTDAEENERITGGISSISYRIDDGEETDVYGMIFQNAMVESCNFAVNITGEGEHTLSVTAVDHAGNENKAQISVYINGEHTYKVEYYKQNITNDEYTRVDDETEILTGVTGSRVEAAVKTFTGFTENLTHESREAFGTVTADDSLVLKLYYDRITYEVDFDLNGMDGETPSAQTVRYGGCLKKVKNPEKKGYSFKGWYTEKEEGSAWDFENTVEANTASRTITLYARCVDDIAPVLGKASYNKGYKNIKNWIIREKNMILTVPITEEGSGVDYAEYILIPEGIDTARMTDTDTAKIRKENGQYVAKITVDEDFIGKVSVVCTDKAGNVSAGKTITASKGGIIVEDNAPEISFSSKEGSLSDWFSDVAAIDVTVEDDRNGKVTGGISEITYQIDGGKAEKVDKNFDSKIVETCDFTVNISGEAEHTLKVTAVDNAGNKNTASIKVKIINSVYNVDTITYRPENTPKSGEPKTGDSMHMELFATLAMLSFFIYLLLHFFAGEKEMTEEKIKRLVSGMLQWKKKGGKHRVLLANVVIFFLLLYYYSIGRLATVGWKKVYGVENG